MTTLYLIRHAEAEGNLYRRIHGWYDALITENGYRQIQALEDRFRDVPVDAVWSSDLFRTRTTARAVCLPKGLEVHTDPQLRELNFGDWEGCSWEEIGRRWPEQFAAYSADRKNYAPPNGESYADMLRRARPFVDALRARPSAGAALCVCHSAVMRGLLAEEAGLEVGESYKKLKLPNGALAELESRV